MPVRFGTLAFVFTFAVLLWCAPPAAAQDDEFGEDADDPVKLFNRGQEAHAKKEYERALELYEQAVKLRPEFPEAEYQKAGALASLNRLAEAEQSYRRAMQLRPAWAHPPAALGLMLARAPGREREAESLLRRALELDEKSLPAVVALAALRTRAGDLREGVALWRRATALNERDASLWESLGAAERAAKETAAALKTFGRALALDPANIRARLQRVELLVEAGDAARALEDMRALEGPAKKDARLAVALTNLYGMAGRAEDARRVYDSLPEDAKGSEEGRKLHAALNARCEDTPESRAALEKLVEHDAKNASALACLGSLYRTAEPQRSLDYFRRALEVEPGNADYATGYAAALLQLRRFGEAASVLRRVLQVAPDNYAAHANYAAALYELKLYKQSIVEYKWVSRARPDLAVVHFFIGSAHDRLGEYEDALSAYETFLARADARVNQLEIEKVNLRLPGLRNQIKRGEGVKSQKKAQR